MLCINVMCLNTFLRFYILNNKYKKNNLNVNMQCAVIIFYVSNSLRTINLTDLNHQQLIEYRRE